jgi:erythrin-vacuolar iron transport family protein
VDQQETRDTSLNTRETNTDQHGQHDQRDQENTSFVTEVAESIKGATEGDEASRQFLLRVVQPGLAGLMDGSVSTLAPIFATAFTTHNSLTTFLVGMAAATGAGISMAFSEALSDSGELTGRGNPVMRGLITGGMTFIGGALHTLPFLVPSIHLALYVAYFVVAFELLVISAIRHRFFGTSWWLSTLQVVGGGALVFAAAWLFGNA